MQDAIAQLGEEFGYPPALLEVLEDLHRVLARTFQDRLLSIILSGSTSTGDFVWRKTTDGTRFLSDIDAIAIVNSRERGDEIAAELEALRRRPEATPLFHVDVTVLPLKGIRHIPHSFQATEIRRAGRVLAGPDMRNVFPSKFRRNSPREAFFFNLWKPFLYRAVRSTHAEFYHQAIARQMLDLALLACSEQNRCVAGHRKRLEAFLALPDGHPLRQADIESALRMAHAVRQGELVSTEAIEAAQFVCLNAAVRFLGIENGGSSIEPTEIQRLLDRRSLRRVAGEIRNELRARRFDPEWICRRKEAYAGAILLEIYRCMHAGVEVDLRGAVGRWLEKFRGGLAGPFGGEDAEAWVRKYYWEGELRLHSASRQSRQWVEEILGGCVA